MTIRGRRLSVRSTPALTERRENAMLIVPTVTGIRTFIGRPSVPHFSISPATCQGQAADAVAALAHDRNLRPLALEILCVPRFAHLQKILNTAKVNLGFVKNSTPAQRLLMADNPLADTIHRLQVTDNYCNNYNLCF